MSWYRTGTVSVTNGQTTVSGASTYWMANVQAGDAFRGPDGKMYEIGSVSGNATLNLAEAYTGATQAGQAYAIAPTQGRVRDLASAVGTLVSEVGALATQATVSGSNVGFGTLSPQCAVHAVGATDGQIEVDGASGDGTLFAKGSGGHAAVLRLKSDGGSGRDFTIASNSAGALVVTDATAGANRLSVDAAGNTVMALTDAAPTLSAARQLVLSRTDDSSVKLSFRGADGVTRSATLGVKSGGAQYADSADLASTSPGKGSDMIGHPVSDPRGVYVTDAPYLADPTGVADATAALNAANNAALAAGRKVYAVGTFKTSGKVTIKGDADYSGATLNVYGTPAVAMEVSTGNAADPTTALFNADVKLPKVINNMTKPGTGWAGQGLGVRLVNLYSCQVVVGNVVCFGTGLQVAGYGTNNCAYNNISLGHLENNKVNLQIVAFGADAAANENAFYGGRFSHYSGEGAGVAGTRHILLSKSANAVNNNLFFKPCVEGDTCEYNVENGGSLNTFIQARWESSTPKVLYTCDNSGQATKNVILGGYGADNIAFSFSGAASTFLNSVVSPSSSAYSGSSATGLLKYRNTSANPIQVFYDTTTKPETAGATDWCVSNSFGKLQGKQKADSYARIVMDYSAGSLSFGDGTAAPPVMLQMYNTGELRVTASSAVDPSTDNATKLGDAARRWSVVYSNTPNISTSDRREKQDIRPLDEAEKAVGRRLKDLVRLYRWRDAVAQKGQNARQHAGWIAQDVIDAFTAEGLDPFVYGCCCYDVWTDDNGVERDRFSVRNDEVIAFILGSVGDQG